MIPLPPISSHLNDLEGISKYKPSVNPVCPSSLQKRQLFSEVWGACSGTRLYRSVRGKNQCVCFGCTNPTLWSHQDRGRRNRSTVISLPAQMSFFFFKRCFHSDIFLKSSLIVEVSPLASNNKITKGFWWWWCVVFFFSPSYFSCAWFLFDRC